jgi:two-component system sensor histidine kinase PilS (NtrC family)
MHASSEPPADPFAGNGALLPEQWVQAVEVCPDAVLVIDAKRRIRGWNGAAEQLFGYTKEEAIGQDFDLLLPAERREAGELQRLRDWNEEGGEIHELLSERVSKTGQTILVRLSRRVLRDASGQLQGAIAILRDVTGSETAMRRAAESLHLARLGRLASQIAHEMRNPLAGIHGAMQILQRRAAPQSEEAEVYDAVGVEIRRLDQLVNDLQRFARPSASRTETFDLGAWLEEVGPRLARNFESTELVLRSKANLQISTDPVLLEEILVELIKNAHEAVGEQELRLDLRVGAVAAGAELQVHDNGPGIAANQAEQIFEPFHSSKARGSGLGLAVARRHAETLGGSLTLAAPRDGSSSGACFVLALPLA